MLLQLLYYFIYLQYLLLNIMQYRKIFGCGVSYNMVILNRQFEIHTYRFAKYLLGVNGDT